MDKTTFIVSMLLGSLVGGVIFASCFHWWAMRDIRRKKYAELARLRAKLAEVRASHK
jgi:formate/nitrite transporter FocA (FNT family)